MDQRWNAYAEFGGFARSDYRTPIYEFNILQFLALAGINRSNDFQAYLAGLAVSSQNDRRRQRTKGQYFFPPHSILPCRPKIQTTYKNPVQWIFVPKFKKTSIWDFYGVANLRALAPLNRPMPLSVQCFTFTERNILTRSV